MEPQQNLRAAVNYAETPEGQAREQEMVSVLERIQLLYDTGTPLFSKAQFRNLEARLNSLKKLKEGEEIDFRIKGIDGVDVKIEDPWAHCLSKPDRFDRASAYLSIHCSASLRPAATLDVAGPDDLIQRLQADFEEKKRDLEATEWFGLLRGFIHRSKPAPVKNIVGFGLGTFHAFDPDDTSVTRHALMLLIRDAVLQIDNLVCFTHDQGYTTVDKKVLKSERVTVLAQPRGFLEVGEQSIVIATRPSAPVKQIIADTSKPSIIIWDKRDTGKQSRLPHPFPKVVDPESSRVDRLLEGYDKLEMPKHVHLGSLVIYIRRVD